MDHLLIHKLLKILTIIFDTVLKDTVYATVPQNEDLRYKITIAVEKAL